MEMYITQVRTFESGETMRITGSPKRMKETPSPSRTASVTARIRKKGSCTDVGAGPSAGDGNSTGPRKKAGTATTSVTINTFTQVFMPSCSFPRNCSSGFLSHTTYWQVKMLSTSLKWASYREI